MHRSMSGQFSPPSLLLLTLLVCTIFVAFVSTTTTARRNSCGCSYDYATHDRRGPAPGAIRYYLSQFQCVSQSSLHCSGCETISFPDLEEKAPASTTTATCEAAPPHSHCMPKAEQWTYRWGCRRGARRSIMRWPSSVSPASRR